MEKIERDCRENQVLSDYPTMTEEELAALYLPMAEHCHVFVWATQKYLPIAFRLIERWGLRRVCDFVWHKGGGFQPFGLPQFNHEYVVYARKGSPVFVDTKDFRTCFTGARREHSVKPEEFYAMVRRVTAGRRLDMFSRREIEGFDSWGQEAPSPACA
jgi:N6-adenosine-specific RNA methylase IME4